ISPHGGAIPPHGRRVRANVGGRRRPALKRSVRQALNNRDRRAAHVSNRRTHWCHTGAPADNHFLASAIETRAPVGWTRARSLVAGVDEACRRTSIAARRTVAPIR